MVSHVLFSSFVLQNLLVSKSFIAHSVVPYVTGEMPSLCGLRWERASHVFGVGNVGTNHWVLFEVSFIQQKVIVFDSLHMPRSSICDYFSHLCRNIPHVLRSQELWGKMQGESPLRDEWEVEIFPNTPRQATLFDCGIMCMKILECLIRGLPLDNFKPDRCGVFRKSYCSQVYAWSQQQKRRCP